jgi:type II secretory pathway pseudopilin PulG
MKEANPSSPAGPVHRFPLRRLFIAGASLVLLGLAAAIVVPNLLASRNGTRQQRTMTDMRTIATAWEARATDRNGYTVEPDGHETTGGDVQDFSTLHRVSAADLERALVPTYLRKLPRTDGWGNEFDFRTGGDKSGAAQIYALRSFGSDGRPDRQPYGSRATTDFKSDLVYTNGSFLQYPDEGG